MERNAITSHLFYGGRHLLAISYNPYLTLTQKHVLHEIAAMMNLQGDFQELREISIDELIRRTSGSRATVFRALAALQEKGYLIRVHRPIKGEPRCKPSLFALTSKIFDEYDLLTVSK